MVEAFSHLAEIFEFRLAEFCLRLEAPLNKKLSGRGRGGDGCRNFSRMFQKAYTPAETFFGRRKCFAGLQELFSDGENVSQVCRNFLRTAKMFRRSAGTFCGWRKRHACLWKHFSEGEML